MVLRRDVSPFLIKFRNFLFGRNHVLTNRTEYEQSKRTQPLPAIPWGPFHILTENPYSDRDAKRMVKRPDIIVDAQKSIDVKENKIKTIESGLPTPGKVHLWDG